MTREECRGLTSFTVILLIFSASFVIGIGAAAASLSTSIDPVATSGLNPGDVFQVTVEVNSDTHDLRSLNMNLYYDSSALQVNSITEDGLLGTGTSILAPTTNGDDGAGTISYGIASTAGPYSPKSGPFVTIEFQVKATAAAGTYNLNLDNVMLVDETITEIPSVVVTDGTATVVGAAFADPTVEVDPQVTSGDSNDSNDLGTTTINDSETDNESSSASTESASNTSVKSVATTQSPDNSAEEVPALEAGSSMFAIVIGVIVIVSYKLKEN